MPDKSTSVAFLDARRPPLQDGEYSIRVTQKVDGQDKFNEFAAAVTFTVAGPQFSLTPQDVVAVFPPPGSLGDHSNVFPHILLKRATLPWERSADLNPDEAAVLSTEPGAWLKAPAPWLALLLFTEAELKNGDVKIPELVTLANLKQADADDAEFVAIDPPDSKRNKPHLLLTPKLLDSTPVSVIDVKRDLLKKLLPSGPGVRLLSHVRQTTVDANQTEMACVVGARLPNSGEVSTMHLVSIEGRFVNGSFTATGNQPYCRLVSLYSWRFSCESHLHTFPGLLRHLNQVIVTSAGVLPDAGTSPDWQNVPDGLRRAFTDAGIALSNQARFLPSSASGGLPVTARVSDFDGNSEQSYTLQTYEDRAHGKQLVAIRNFPSSLRLPRNADSETENMLSSGFNVLPHAFRDGSQTFSWYRGPLAPGDTLASVTLPAKSSDALLTYDGSTGLFFTGYAAAWELGRTLCLANPRVSQALYQWKREHARFRRHDEGEAAAKLSNLPVPAPTDPGPMPSVVTDWFESLRRLEGVPFPYLVPDERMLPVESIRFFHVDPYWIECLVDGAFSIGRVMSSDHEHDTFLSNQLSNAAGTGAAVSGLILRSALVSGWPLLIVEAFGDAGMLTPRRTARLSPDTLLCLFDGDAQQYLIRLPDESLHFGIEPSDDEQSEKSQPELRKAGIHLDQKSRLLTFSKKIRTDPSEFALKMILGVPQMTFGVAGGKG